MLYVSEINLKSIGLQKSYGQTNKQIDEACYGIALSIALYADER